MPKIAGELFPIGTVAMTEGAHDRAVYLQRRKGWTDPEKAVANHSTLLLMLHATGQHGHIHPSDKILNTNNIARNNGRVISVVGNDYPFLLITELPTGDTLITTPEEI